MELDVLQFVYSRKKTADIAYAINEAVAKRVCQMARSLTLPGKMCITGGVSKNRGVVSILEKMLDTRFLPLEHDAQLMGALGAAYFAAAGEQNRDKTKQDRPLVNV